MNDFRLSIPRFLKEPLVTSQFLGRKTGYKFHNSRDTSAICDTGSIKIGTLEEYRRHEKEKTRDKNEGLVTFQTPKDHDIEVTDFHAENPIHSAVHLAGGSRFILKNSTVSFRTLECYIYCYSFECTDSVRQSFDDADSYDSVAEITDIDAMATTVCKYHPQIKGSKYLNLPVIYRDNHRSHDDIPPHPLQVAFEKLAIFSKNTEGRIVFILPEGARYVGPLQPWAHPELKAVFRRHPMPHSSST